MFRKKKKIPCKFCGNNTVHMKQYNDSFCSDCERFQSEDSVKEIKLLPIFKIKTYNFAAQKYTYIVYNSLGSKIAFAEKRDVTKYISDKNYNIRYYFFNDVNRVIGSVDGSSTVLDPSIDASWKVYDYGRNFRAEIKYLAKSESWQIIDASGAVIAVRDFDASQPIQKRMREFTFVDPENKEEIFFQAKRKAGFILQLISETFDPHIGWGFIVALHQKLYA